MYHINSTDLTARDAHFNIRLYSDARGLNIKINCTYEKYFFSTRQAILSENQPGRFHVLMKCF